MKKNQIIAFRRDMFKAKFAYHHAVVEMLKECGKELEVVSDLWDDDEDYPKGVHLTTLGDDGEAYDVVVDRIRYEEKEPVFKVGIHVCRYDYKEVDYWWGINDLMDECADYVISSIVWDENSDADTKGRLDERLQLTDDQLIAINRYNNAVKDLLESGVQCVFREFGEIGAFNGSEVEEVTFEEETTDGDMVIQFGDLMQIECPFGLNLVTNDRTFSVRLSEK